MLKPDSILVQPVLYRFRCLSGRFSVSVDSNANISATCESVPGLRSLWRSRSACALVTHLVLTNLKTSIPGQACGLVHFNSLAGELIIFALYPTQSEAREITENVDRSLKNTLSLEPCALSSET